MRQVTFARTLRNEGRLSGRRVQIIRSMSTLCKGKGKGRPRILSVLPRELFEVLSGDGDRPDPCRESSI